MSEIGYPICAHGSQIDTCGETHDYGIEAQRFAEDHLVRCEDAMDREEQAHDVDWTALGALAPYCGCTTCQVRETLNAGWAIFELYMKEAQEDLQAELDNLRDCL